MIPKKKKKKKKLLSSISRILIFCYSRDTVEEFPGGLVVRILGFHSCGRDSIPSCGTEILHAAWQKKKKKKTLLGELRISPRTGENIFSVCTL